MIIEAVVGLLIASFIAATVIKTDGSPEILLVAAVLFFVVVMVLSS